VHPGPDLGLVRPQINQSINQSFISNKFKHQCNSNKVKLLGHEQKVDLFPIRTVTDFIIISHGGGGYVMNYIIQ